MRVAVRDIAYYLPEQVVTNEALHAEYPTWDMARVADRSGVMSRHIAREDETALDLAMEACRKLFLNNPDVQGKIGGIIFCTQSPDYIMPPNACLLHDKLELGDDVLAFDFNLACSGFIYGLAIARGLIQSGMTDDILLVTADTYSKYINAQDRSARVLFGDGAAATWIAASDATQGIIDIICSTSGKGYDRFIVPAGACRIPRTPETSVLKADRNGNKRTLENIHMDGFSILTFVNSKVPRQIHRILELNDMTIDVLDLFVFHQASRVALDSLSRRLKLRPEKVFRNLDHIGNTVSASVPIALSDALRTGALSRGDKVLVSGFGVGLSWGTALIEI